MYVPRCVSSVSRNCYGWIHAFFIRRCIATCIVPFSVIRCLFYFFGHAVHTRFFSRIFERNSLIAARGTFFVKQIAKLQRDMRKKNYDPFSSPMQERNYMPLLFREWVCLLISGEENTSSFILIRISNCKLAQIFTHVCTFIAVWLEK